ncbi:MAG: hypothetical protein A2X86_02405 [Bdellovibrionales bacterium GWA2_49_15]|nr:MAG: hypothetical protein A2X86_02405 [Bdellovibrionales bacterium GWA2_49_15]
MKKIYFCFLILLLTLVSCAHQSQVRTRSIQNPNDDKLAHESKDRFSEERLSALQKTEGAGIDCRLGDTTSGFNKLQTMYKDNEMKSAYWLTLGNCSIQNMDFDRAYYFFKLALTKAKNKTEEARVYNNLGVLLWKKKNYEDAVSHFLEARKRATLLSPIFNLCSLYVARNQLALAEGIISQAPKELSQDPEWKMLTTLVKGQ